METIDSQRKNALTALLFLASVALFAAPVFSETLWFLVFLALIPLLIIAEKHNAKSTALIAFAVGFLYLFLVFYPISTLNTWWWSPDTFFLENRRAVFVLANLVASAVFSALTFYPTMFVYYKFLRKNPLVILGLPTIWVFTELIRARILSGIEWGMIGQPLGNSDFFIGLSKFGGVFSLSFVVVIINISLFLLAKSFLEKSSHRHRLLPVAALILVVGLGLYADQEKPAAAEAREIRVAIISPNISTTDTLAQSGFEHLMGLIEKSLEESPDLIVLPENIFPDIILDQNNLVEPTSGDLLAKEKIESVLKISVENPATSFVLGMHTKSHEKRFNSAVVIEEGQLVSVYGKKHLVPFTEKSFGPIKSYSGTVDRGINERRVTTQHGDFAPMICSEILVSDTRSDSPILNLSNDNIFDSKRFKKYVEISAKIRAVYHNQTIIRSSKGGFSGILGQDGSVFPVESLSQNEILIGTIEYPDNTRYLGQ